MTAAPVEAGVKVRRDVSRTALLNRLRAASAPIVAIAAPAGYGKTTLLAQWAARDPRPFAWLTLAGHDDEPGRLYERVAEELGRAAPPRGPGGVRPYVLVLDDAHVVQRSVDDILELAGRFQPGCALVLAGRNLDAFPLARLRAEERLLELRANDLALTNGEARRLLPGHAAGDAITLNERAEGWAAGLVLTADDDGLRLLAGYLRSECTDELEPDALRFLSRCAVLDRLSGPLCDAVAGRGDSARRLHDLHAGGLFLVAVPGGYRWHLLVRELLLTELDRSEPELVPQLHGRAAAWLETNGDLEAALEHAAAAGDAPRVLRLCATAGLRAYHEGRLASVERWLKLPDDEMLAAGEAAPLATWIRALRGRYTAAERLLAAAPPAPWTQLLRSALCAGGAGQMRADAAAAAARLALDDPWLPVALCLQGIACGLLDERDSADELLADAAGLALEAGATDTRMLALAERSLLAHDDALGAAARALAVDAGLRAYPTAALAFCASARAQLRRGDLDSARRDLADADRLTPQLSPALPWLSARALLELALAHIAVLDFEAAWALHAQATAILRRRPGLDGLVALAQAVRAELQPRRAPALTRLTAAELRLLPLLATHLSFREIGERLHVSRNTVKTQAISTYRKFGVSSRSDAIACAARLGLVDSELFSLLI